MDRIFLFVIIGALVVLAAMLVLAAEHISATKLPAAFGIALLVANRRCVFRE
jgi:uncharacterized membrane protein HdeD (DUF308 family)